MTPKAPRQVHLKAHALSRKHGAKVNELIVKGQAIAENSAVPDYDFSTPPSVIGQIEIGGKLIDGI